jgi:regulator of sigma E protease
VNIALAAVAVSLLILVHELGHFTAAKAVGMRVEVFSIGFWKKLFGVRIGETEYRLSLIPFGGYVKVKGESAEQGKGERDEFWSKSPGQRALFIVGGVTMNFVLAMVLFIVAFAIGVPFTVAEVGSTRKGEPAWEAGLKPGDRITAVGENTSPVFVDITRSVVLSRRDEVRLRVRRDGRQLAYRISPRYNEELGLKLIGVVPPIEPVVQGLAKVGGEDGVSPAQEAGIEMGDRILAINGRSVETAQDLMAELENYPNDPVELRVEREGRTFTCTARTRPVPHYQVGISGMGTTVEKLEGDGMAERIGIRVGDRIAAVNGTPVQSWVEVEQVVRAAPGATQFLVERGGRELTLSAQIPDLRTLAELIHSVELETGTLMVWVEQDGPAWEAGLRPGDRIVAVEGEEVKTWEDVLTAGRREPDEPYTITWVRRDAERSATVTPVEDTSFSPGHLGVLLSEERRRPVRYGVVGAVEKGMRNTVATIGEILLTLRGFATREVSPRHVGGIVRIAYVSYDAARQGIGYLVYLTAVISAALAFGNLLPIPVLDGGHLMFVAIEKVRGRRLSERAMAAAQTVGFVVVVLIVVAVTFNDVMSLLRLR